MVAGLLGSGALGRGKCMGRVAWVSRQRADSQSYLVHGSYYYISSILSIGSSKYMWLKKTKYRYILDITVYWYNRCTKYARKWFFCYHINYKVLDFLEDPIAYMTCTEEDGILLYS